MGHAEPAPQGPPRSRGKLAPYQAFVKELIAQDPDMTIFSPGLFVVFLIVHSSVATMSNKHSLRKYA